MAVPCPVVVLSGVNGRAVFAALLSCRIAFTARQQVPCDDPLRWSVAVAVPCDDPLRWSVAVAVPWGDPLRWSMAVAVPCDDPLRWSMAGCALGRSSSGVDGRLRAGAVLFRRRWSGLCPGAILSGGRWLWLCPGAILSGGRWLWLCPGAILSGGRWPAVPWGDPLTPVGETLRPSGGCNALMRCQWYHPPCSSLGWFSGYCLGVFLGVLKKMLKQKPSNHAGFHEKFDSLSATTNIPKKAGNHNRGFQPFF